MKRIILLAALAVPACRLQPIPPQSHPAQLAASKQTQIVQTQKLTSERLISNRGIGQAKLGMTLATLRKISSPDTEFELISSFAEGVDAIAIKQKGIMQYYILYDRENTESADTLPIEKRAITALMTENDNYQTAQGVKVGTLIKDAEAIYGNAILAYNTEGGSEEYITFSNEHPDNIRFRASYFKLISDGLGYSGIYPEYPGVSYVTDKYHDDAAIAAIEVICDTDNCLN